MSGRNADSGTRVHWHSLSDLEITPDEFGRVTPQGCCTPAAAESSSLNGCRSFYLPAAGECPSSATSTTSTDGTNFPQPRADAAAPPGPLSSGGILRHDGHWA